MAASQQVVVIGLDGADWSQIRPLLDEGEMPNLEAVIEEGSSGDLSSSYPVMSPVAWTSYSTGSDPSVHGIYDFLQRSDGGFRPTTAREIEAPFFWKSINGTKVVINQPMTFPPVETEGALVSGYLASSDSTYTYPPELSDELNSQDYIIEALSGGYSDDRRGELLERFNETVEERTDAALHLLEKHDPRFFQVVYTGLDRLQHYYPLQPSESEYSGAVPSHYRKLDEQIGRIIEATDDNATVIVMSDHGFQDLDREIYLNYWMREKGYLEMKGGRSLLGRLGITQQKVAPVLERLNLLEAANKVLGFVGLEPEKSVPQPTLNDINLSETKAYAGNYRGAVYVVEENVEDPESFKEKLKEELQQLEINGESPFRKIIDTDSIYARDVGESPDLVVVPRDGYHVVGFLGEGRLSTTRTEKSGIHARDGMIAINRNIELDNPHITDVAPTLLDMMDEEIPEYMTGSSVLE